MNTIGENLKLTIFGESHGYAVGMVLDGLPAGEEIDKEKIMQELARRAPGSSELSSPRKEKDEPIFLSGLFEGHTTGAPLCAMIKNTDSDSSTYLQHLPRPSHSDLTALIKFKGFADYRGGGPFSGRLTAPMVLAGGICRQVLLKKGVSISARIVQVGEFKGEELDFAMQKEILDARASGDSVGAAIECAATGVPAGVGGLMFGGMESRLAALIYAIPGVKGLEFGAGFSFAGMRGSQANDPIRIEDGRIFTEMNNSGGINGGITNGMPLITRIALRPTPTIGREQKTVDMQKMENATIRGRGRHDPCLAPRALPAVEAAVAFAILDAMLD
jgi:chorismate synthase